MSETFACPQCGKSYLHAGRKPGKAVLCLCGHRFLVPAPEVRTAPTKLPLQPEPQQRQPEPSSSKLTIPIASPAAPRPQPTRSASSPRSSPARPKELVAEVVYPGDSAEMAPLAEVISQNPYAPAPLPALPVDYGSYAAPAARRHAPRSKIESSQLFGLWLGRAVLFVLVPLAMLCVFIADMQMHRTGGVLRYVRQRQPAFRMPSK